MMIYPRDDERAIRVQRMVDDWAKSGLLQPEQRDRMMADLAVDYRRTNRFLRIALFLFGFLIVNAFIGLLAVTTDLREGFGYLLMLAALGAFFLAQWSIARYRLYRFGVEEALAVSVVTFFGFGAAIFTSSGFSSLRGFIGLAGAAFIVFTRFGYLYAGMAAVLCAGVIPLSLQATLTETTSRLFAIVILFVIFGLARERRKDHEWEFPGDLYGAVETTAWAAMYVATNLKASQWLSYPDAVPQFYWATYAGIWIIPAAGLFMAIRDRHRWMLDANIVMAIVTLMSNKPYLNGVQKPWDPILFGVLMIAIALGLKRWLASGANGSRNGFMAERLLASEHERLAVAGSATALRPGAPEPHAHPSPELGDGGRSGGAGASGRF
jgi:hypothetical protein